MTVKEYLEERNSYLIDTREAGVKKEKSSHYFPLIEYNKSLIEKYPWLKIKSIMEGDKKEYDYEYTWLDNLATGWRIAFGDEICEEIQQELIKFNYVNSYQILDIKEKYGSLRWYDGGFPIGELSKNYIEITLGPRKSRKDFPEYNNKNYFWEHTNTDHFISIFDEKAKSMGNEEREKYNDEATYYYRVYKILEPCKIPFIISKYEDLSYSTCILCGEKADWLSEGWISPYCDACARKIVKGYLKEKEKEDDILEKMFHPIFK